MVVVLLVGIEPTTPSLRVTCSTFEPQQRMNCFRLSKIYHRCPLSSTEASSLSVIYYSLYFMSLFSPRSVFYPPGCIFSLSSFHASFIKNFQNFPDKLRHFLCFFSFIFLFSLHNSKFIISLQIVIHIPHRVSHNSLSLCFQLFFVFLKKMDRKE